MHTYDAQAAVGAPEPLPAEVAVDGVEEFLHTCNATTGPWPHEPTAIDYFTAEGPPWRLTLDADGARAARLSPEDDPAAAGASMRAAASNFVLTMYGRVPLGTLELGGDPAVIDRLVEWVPEE